VIRKLSRKIGFTVAEIKVLFFLIFVFIAGLSYKAYKLNNGSSEYKEFDYSTEERLFERLNDNKIPLTDSVQEDKYIDYKQEVLDFNSSDFHKKEAKKLPGSKSININTAGIEDLVMLPGIGEKTAQKIIDLRKTKGGFSKLEELYEVKGIGKTRFNKIEKFLYIDH
jgi:competence protein ComEA